MAGDVVDGKRRCRQGEQDVRECCARERAGVGAGVCDRGGAEG